ncbi:diguanylate cyclase (GGDEF)-like protein [Blastococcus colisei]|uniref:Diguanylate cyclase (GGDEF)-like protein n=1 Tax=Blastococcus colisei TaxID=1564162 RepID=A0A543PF47_9ACTN|nr:GGDEF domain-containing protein [Blastococcus colisei]TQN42703.1 diguanylate cyclase (GGDEF)-like protein [Blastococcus colisei]
MHARSRAFLCLLVLLATATLGIGVWRALPAMQAAASDVAVVTAAVALLLFSPVTVGRRARAAYMTFGETAGVLAFAVLPPAAAALACSAAALGLVLTLRTSATNRLFNAASSVTAAAAGGLTAAALQASGTGVLTAAAVAALVFGAVSHVLVVTFLSIERGRLVPNFGAGLRQLAAVETAGTVLGLAVAPLLMPNPTEGWRLLPLLLVLAVLSRRQAQLAAERDLLDDLAVATQDMHLSLRHDEVVDALHAHAARLLPRSGVTIRGEPPGPDQVGVPVGDGASWLVARSGVAQVGVPTEERVLSGLATAARHALENARLHRRVEEQARTDALTGLPNRGALVLHLDRELARAGRHGGHVGLVFLDLDGFKAVNDEQGHEAGDALLVELAGHLRTATRTEDFVARLAGDEFCIVLTGVSGQPECVRVAEELRAAVEQGMGTAGVGVSMGVALGPEDGADPAALLHAADLRMYADKAVRSRRRTGPRSSRTETDSLRG